MTPKQFGQIETKLDRIESKLDNHMERITKVELEVTQIRGSIKIAVSFAVAVVSAAVGAILKWFHN